FVLTNHADLGDTGKKTGWHCSEVSHPYRILTEAGCEVSFASPDGGPVPMDPASEDKSDPVNAKFMESPMIQAALMYTLSAEEVQAGIFQAIFFAGRSEEHTSELQSRENLVCRLLLEKKKRTNNLQMTQS